MAPGDLTNRGLSCCLFHWKSHYFQFLWNGCFCYAASFDSTELFWKKNPSMVPVKTTPTRNKGLGLRWSSSALFKDSCELEMKKGTLMKSWNKNNIFQSFNVWFSLSYQFHLLVYSKFWIWKFQRCLYLGLSFNRPKWVVSTIGAVALRREMPKDGWGTWTSKTFFFFFHMYIYIIFIVDSMRMYPMGGTHYWRSQEILYRWFTKALDCKMIDLPQVLGIIFWINHPKSTRAPRRNHSNLLPHKTVCVCVCVVDQFQRSTKKIENKMKLQFPWNGWLANHLPFIFGLLVVQNIICGQFLSANKKRTSPQDIERAYMGKQCFLYNWANSFSIVAHDFCILSFFFSHSPYET